MKGILADAHMIGDVENLVAAMQREPWSLFWKHLGLVLYTFEEVGLTPTSPDTEIWLRCQAEQLVLVTDNRNKDSPDSLESAIQHTYAKCRAGLYDWQTRSFPKEQRLR